MAAGGADKSVIVWNAADAKEVKKFANLPGAVNAIAFSPDGKYVAAGLADNSLRLLDIATGKEAKSFAGHTGPVTGVAFTAQGRPAHLGQRRQDDAGLECRRWQVGAGSWTRAAPQPASP